MAASDGKSFPSMNPCHPGQIGQKSPKPAPKMLIARSRRRIVPVMKARGRVCRRPSVGIVCGIWRICWRNIPNALARWKPATPGKMFKETRWQAKYISEFYHFFAGAADKINGETLPIDKPDMFVFYQPRTARGDCGGGAWNSQLFSVGG